MSSPAQQTEQQAKPGIFERLHFNQYKSSVIVEFIGTFLFILTIPLSGITNAEMSPLAVGFMLMSMVFCFGYISGGHFNPAVSFAAWLSTESFTKDRLVLYWLAQIGGGFAAVFYCVMIHGPDFPTPSAGLDGLSMFRAFLAESVYTFVLASVVLHVACSRQKDNNFYGFAIGMAVLGANLAVGGVSGGAFNPAVATSLIVVRCITTYCVPLAGLWVYWTAALLGALVASIFYCALLEIKDDE